MVGLLTFMRAAESDPNLVTLASGIDLTGLGLNLNSQESLHPTFAGPFADHPCRWVVLNRNIKEVNDADCSHTSKHLRYSTIYIIKEQQNCPTRITNWITWFHSNNYYGMKCNRIEMLLEKTTCIMLRVTIKWKDISFELICILALFTIRFCLYFLISQRLFYCDLADLEIALTMYIFLLTYPI